MKLILKYSHTAIALLLATCIFFLLLPLTDPPGVGSYYYLKQIKHYTEYFSFYFSDHSLSFYVPIAINLLIKNVLLAFKLSIAFSIGCLIYFQLKILRLLYKDRSAVLLGSILIISFNVLNSCFYEMQFGYFKNAMAIVFLHACLYYSLQYLETNMRKHLVLIYIFSILSIFTHKSSVLFLSIIGGSYILSKWSITLKKVFFIVGLSTITAIVFFTFYPKAFLYIEYITNQSLLDSAYLSWLWKTKSILPSFGLYVIYLTSVFLCVSLLLTKQTLSLRFISVFILASFTVSIYPFFKSGTDQIGYRLLLVMSCFFGLFSILFISKKLLRYFSLLIILCFSYFLYTFPPQKRLLSNLSTVETQVLTIAKYVDKDKDYLVAHHGLGFYIDYLTDIRARIFVPNNPKEFRQVYRIAFAKLHGYHWQLLRSKLNEKALLRFGGYYFLVTENDWQDITKEVKVPRNWKNPYEVNPGHVYE